MQSINEQIESSYNEILYLSSAFPVSRPDNLAVVGTLAGLTPTPVEHCRVLEIGCAAGRNLLPMAQALPQSQFVGIDLSEKQIVHAVDIAGRAKLTNVEFICQNLLDYTPTAPFDYIVAHGIYSWVPRVVRDRIFQLCQSHLNPSGLVYISYNTLPGWHIKQITRDLMLFHTRDATTTQQRLSGGKEILSLVFAAQGKNASIYSSAIRDLAQTLASSQEWYLAHDDLEAVSEPVYFHQFIEHAKSFGLRYVGAAEPGMNLAGNIAPYWRDKLAKSCRSIMDLEQYADFISGTQYRSSVLCRNDATITTSGGPAAVKGMYVAATAVEGFDKPGTGSKGETRFRNPLTKGELITSNPDLIRVLRHLSGLWPHAVSFTDLLKLKGPVSSSNEVSLEHSLLAAYTTNTIEFWTRPTTFLAGADEQYPLTTPLARLQVEAGEPLINLRHMEFAPVDHFVKRIIPLLDGTNDLPALIEALKKSLKNGEFSLTSAEGSVTADRGAEKFLKNAMKTFSLHSLLVNTIKSL